MDTPRFTMVAIVPRGICVGMKQPSHCVVWKCETCGDKFTANTMAFHKH